MASWLCTACSTPTSPTVNLSLFNVCQQPSCQRKASIFGASVHTRLSPQHKMKQVMLRTETKTVKKVTIVKGAEKKKRKKTKKELAPFGDFEWLSRHLSFDIDDLEEFLCNEP